MVLESALLHVELGQNAAIEAAWGEPRHIIGTMRPSVTVVLEHV